MKRTFSLAALLAAGTLVGTANAATIVFDFDDNNAEVDSNDFGSGVTVSDVTTGGISNTFINQRWQRQLLSGASTFVFKITIPNSVTVDLTQLDFVGGIDSNTGANDVFGQWDLSIDTGSATTSSWTDTVAGTGESFTSNGTALVGLTGLTNTTVTFTFTTYLGTAVGPPPTSGNNNNRFTTIDDLVITGSAVPEPGSLALMGLGGLCVLRRRRG